MKFAQNNHPTRLFGPTGLFGTWEYFIKGKIFAQNDKFSTFVSQKLQGFLPYSQVQIKE